MLLQDDTGAADLQAPELFLFTPIVEGGDQDYNTLGEANVSCKVELNKLMQFSFSFTGLTPKEEETICDFVCANTS